MSQKGRTSALFDEALRTAWVKNWSGTWSILECCSYGREYSSVLFETWGKGLGATMFRFANGKSEHYIAADAIDSFSRHLVEQLSSEEALDQYVRELSVRIDTCLAFLKRETLDDAAYDQLWKILDAFLAYNFPTKRLPEYLPASLAERVLPSMQELRLRGEPIYERSQQLMDAYFAGLGERFALPGHFVTMLTKGELRDMIERGVHPPTGVLNVRYELSVLIVCDDTCEIYTGDNVGKLFPEAKVMRELRGKTAYPGKASGKACVVRDPHAVPSLPEGSVLVTGMTRPDYMHLFRQAVAVITDAGGILSHAAITARELKKPCIIGVEIATQVLKDGDMVEVDANEGVVHVIAKHS